MQHDFVLGLMQHDFVLALMQHAFVLARIRLTRTAAERGPVLSGERGQMSGFQSLVCTGRLCSSPRSEHGILGKRRVKLRSPAVGRTPRGCQPDEQFRPRLSGTLWSAAVRVRGSRAQRRGRWTTQLTSTARDVHFSRIGHPLTRASSARRRAVISFASRTPSAAKSYVPTYCTRARPRGTSGSSRALPIVGVP